MCVRTGNTAHQKAKPDMELPALESVPKMEQATGDCDKLSSFAKKTNRLSVFYQRDFVVLLGFY